MGRILVIVVTGLAVVGGCGRADEPVGAVPRAPQQAPPAPAAAATTAPSAVPPLSMQVPVDLAGVEALLAGVDRALAESAPGPEEDPST